VVAVTRAGEVSSNVEVEALCRGAAVLSREDNRIAARALLWAAVAIDPQNFVAHRRLAAALLNGEDADAAAEEYARFIELLLKESDVHRAAAELAYARSFLGDVPQLRPAATHLVPLGDIAKSLDSSGIARSSRPLALADYVATRVPSKESDVDSSEGLTKSGDPRPWYRRWTSGIGLGEWLIVLALAIATVVAALRLAGFIDLPIGAP
jgi:tetratricopeptide (TPR) repeat protein